MKYFYRVGIFQTHTSKQSITIYRINHQSKYFELSINYVENSWKEVNFNLEVLSTTLNGFANLILKLKYIPECLCGHLFQFYN